MTDGAKSRSIHHRAIQIAHPAFLLLALALLLALNGPSLAASGLNNLASLQLASEWRTAFGTAQEPGCLPHTPQPEGFDPSIAALRYDSSQVRAWLNLGRVHWLGGRCSEAVAAWQHAAAADPNDQTAPLLIATGQFAAGDPSAFVRLLGAESAAKYAADNGERAALAGKQDAAAFWYELAFGSQPTRVAAKRLADSYLARDRNSDAATVWLQLSDVLPTTDSSHWWALGQAAALGQDWTLAASAYSQGAAVANDSYPYWLQAGYASLNGRDAPGADRYFTLALAARPDNPEPLIGLGRARYLQEDYASSMAHFRRAAQLAPASFEPPYWIGLIQWRQADYTQARRSFQAVLQLNPTHAPSRYYLARSDYFLGYLPEAIEDLQQALDLARRSTSATKPWDWALLLGDWQVQAGDRPAALASYRLALEWHPNDPTILKRIEAVR